MSPRIYNKLSWKLLLCHNTKKVLEEPLDLVTDKAYSIITQLILNSLVESSQAKAKVKAVRSESRDFMKSRWE